MRCEETMRTASNLPDETLIAEVTRLAGSERAATAGLIAHLAEFDARRLHLAAGYPSLFSYCTHVLRLSEHEAYNRIEAARLVRRFPIIVDRIENGELNLTSLRLLAPHLTEDNHEALLAEASHKSKKEVEAVVVRYCPQPDVLPSVRRLPASPTAPTPASPIASPVSVSVEAPGGADIGVESRTVEPLPLPATRRRDVVRPLAPERCEIRFTASAQVCEKLQLAKDLLRHVVPHGDIADVFDRALTALLEDLARKKFAATDRARPGSGRCANRHIPAVVKRAVWLRDGGRCAFVAKGARRCNARGFLEFHHVQPYAVGGPATTENIEIRCRAHNAYEADLFYGQREQVSAIRGTRSGTSPPAHGSACEPHVSRTRADPFAV
jgi:hypothetical protein